LNYKITGNPYVFNNVTINSCKWDSLSRDSSVGMVTDCGLDNTAIVVWFAPDARDFSPMHPLIVKTHI
jgi:hypothetical protein